MRKKQKRKAVEARDKEKKAKADATQARRAAAVEAMKKGSSKKGDTKNPLLNMRGDGFQGSDEEEEEDEEMFVLPDEGHGVFPPEAGAKELGTQYEKLPPIFDADEEEEAKRKRMVAYMKEREN